MPWTLYRYILKELFKMLIPAALVLLVVFSFATAIKPLNEGILGPWALILFIYYTIPTMLMLVLPFAGVYAITLAFCRAVSDNEITACLSSGMSYRTILLPVLFVGLLLTLTLFYMSNWVVPSFYRKVAVVLQQDVAQILVSQIQNGHAVKLRSGVILHAEAAKAVERPQLPGHEIQPNQGILVRGVVVGEFAPDGLLRREASAEAADIYFFRDGGQAWVEMRLEDGMAYDQHSGVLWRSSGVIETNRIFLSSRFRDNMKFSTWPELSRIGRDPDADDGVGNRKNVLVRLMSAQKALSELATALTDPSSGPAVLERPQAEIYHISAPRVVHDGETLKLSGDGRDQVQLHIVVGGVAHSDVRAEHVTISVDRQTTRALINFDPAYSVSEPWLSLECKHAVITDLSGRGEQVEQTKFTRRGRLPLPVAERFIDMKVRDLLALVESDPKYNEVPEIRRAAAKTVRTLSKLKREIIAQLNLRGASAIAAVLFLMFGALLSLRMGKSLPLVVYFWTFLAAMIVVVMTHGGENLITDQNYGIAVGLLITWLGDVLLAGAVAVLYWRVSLH